MRYADRDNLTLIDSVFLRDCYSIYLGLSLFEFAFNSGSGSILKFFGFAIIGLWFIFTIKGGIKTIINAPTKRLIGWWLALLISLLWSKNFSVGFYYIYSIANMLCLIVVGQNIRWDRKSIIRLLKIYSLSAVIMGIIVIVKGNLYHGVGIRYTIYLFGKEMDPNGISAYLAVPVLIMVDFAIQKVKGWKLFILGICICGYAMLLTGSRGGLVAVAIGIVSYLSLDTFWSKKSAVKVLRAAMIVLILGGVLYYIVTHFLGQDIFARLFEFDNYTENRGSDRLDLWALALSYYAKSPIIGLGVASYGAITGRGIHNMYIDALCDCGVFSFLFFVMGQLKLITIHIKKRNVLAVAMMLCMMTYIVFLDAYQKKFMWNVIIIAIILLQLNKNEKRPA